MTVSLQATQSSHAPAADALKAKLPHCATGLGEETGWEALAKKKRELVVAVALEMPCGVCI